MHPDVCMWSKYIKYIIYIQATIMQTYDCHGGSSASAVHHTTSFRVHQRVILSNNHGLFHHSLPSTSCHNPAGNTATHLQYIYTKFYIFFH